MWRAIFSRGLGPLVVSRGMIRGNHYRSILEDHLLPMLHTLFPGECPVFQNDNTYVHMSRCLVSSVTGSEILERLWGF
ncbi:hypothetical protein TNCV_1024151 [Trichonephila clavipes]|nr:hypothetical protein TNCV_1024151 [Trichonephila clavipes]